MKLCGGIQSPVNPSRPLRLCLDCARYSFGEDTMNPCAHRAGGDSWVCDSMVSSMTVAKQSSAGSGTDTGAGFFSGGEMSDTSLAPPKCGAESRR